MFFGGDGSGPGMDGLSAFPINFVNRSIIWLKINLSWKSHLDPITGAGFIPTIGDGGDGDVIIDGEGEAPPPPCGLLCTMLREFQVNRE